MSMLTFGLSAEVVDIGFPSTYDIRIYFSRKPLANNFHMKAPNGRKLYNTRWHHAHL